MPPSEAIRTQTLQRILLDGQEVECRFVVAKTAKKLRIKVKPAGIEVVIPENRSTQDGLDFVAKNQAWVVEQLERVRQLSAVKRPDKPEQGQILFRGEPTPVNLVQDKRRRAANKVVLEDGIITITCGLGFKTTASQSLENWLRKQARASIEGHLEMVGKRVKRTPNRIYVMGQRTKWGNCSALGNLSFNWRLIMAPDYVLQYIVTHEAVHLAIPDHSKRFWLAVQSHCPSSERARQWLVASGNKLTIDLKELI